jgi:hypothetical protein
MSQLARQLAEAVFALHPAAKDRVLLHLGEAPSGGPKRVVVSMDVPATDPARTADSPPDRALQTARISELVADLATTLPTTGNELTVMRDRVIWMPAVLPINPPLP